MNVVAFLLIVLAIAAGAWEAMKSKSLLPLAVALFAASLMVQAVWGGTTVNVY